MAEARTTASSCIAVIAIGAISSWLSSPLASADILLESHLVERPADADRILGPFRDELAAGGVAIRPAAVIAAAGDQLPLPERLIPPTVVRTPPTHAPRSSSAPPRCFAATTTTVSRWSGSSPPVPSLPRDQ
jgi:hypothetical protein